MSKIKPRQVAIAVFSFFLRLSMCTVYAGGGLPPPPKPTPTPTLTPPDFGKLVGSVYNLLYPIAIILGILQIIIAGYKIMTSGGEPKALGEAKDHLTGSIIGIIFVILGVVILKIIIGTFLGGNIG